MQSTLTPSLRAHPCSSPREAHKGLAEAQVPHKGNVAYEVGHEHGQQVCACKALEAVRNRLSQGSHQRLAVVQVPRERDVAYEPGRGHEHRQ